MRHDEKVTGDQLHRENIWSVKKSLAVVVLWPSESYVTTCSCMFLVVIRCLCQATFS
jgi:hypothetical protein